MTQPFIYRFTVQLHDVDGAGRLFFGHLFRHAHDAYEALMTELGYPLPEMIQAGEILLPLIHAEADYHRPIHHGERIDVKLRVDELRRRSFSIGYRFENAEGAHVASARTAHVQIERQGQAVRALTAPLHAALSRLYVHS